MDIKLLINKISDNETTRKNYESTAILLLNLFGNDWIDIIIKKPRKIINDIIEYYKQKTGSSNQNTLKNVFSRIVKILRTIKAPKKIIDIYSDKMMKYQREVNEDLNINRFDGKIKQKWCSWNKILQIRNKLKEKAKDLKSYQTYLILCLFTYIAPIRLDYNNINVIKDKKDAKDTSKNYLALKQKEFILNSYKTAKTYNTAIIKIPNELFKIIVFWFKNYNKKMKYLLITPSKPDQSLSKKNLSYMLNQIFFKYCGKLISVSMLRHIFISEILPKLKTSGEKKTLAKAMLHSTNLQSLYEKKKENSSIGKKSYDQLLDQIMKISNKL